MKEIAGPWAKTILVLFALAQILSAAGCVHSAPRAEKAERSEVALGTVARLRAEGAEAERAVSEAFARLAEIEAEFDAGNPESSVARLNASAGSGEWVPLSPGTWRVLSLSERYSRATGGAWDATIGPLSSLWRRAARAGVPPSEAEIAAARERVGFAGLELRGSDGSARLASPGAAIDLGGVLKGYALDECRKIFARRGVTGLIDLGTSSIAAVGGKGSGEPFRVALRHPRGDASSRLGVIDLKDAVISSSGDYERYFMYEGVRYHHILDPRTGLPAESGAASVSVVIDAAEEDAGLIADMLSTALFVMGAEAGLPALETLPIRARAIFADERGISAVTEGTAIHTRTC